MLLVSLVGIVSERGHAREFNIFTSTEAVMWKESGNVRSSSKKSGRVVEKLPAPVVFGKWGTCFNERGYDALDLLNESDRKVILRNVFAKEGDLRICMGRIPMNANDYARDWYSCDEVAGDFALEYFNIDRDRETIIPHIREAQELCPDMTFWASPWCPPSWMKINADYPVRSDRTNTMDPRKDALLFPESEDKSRDDYKAPKGTFPPQLSNTDYFIQDARHLQAYADYFCRFIDEYGKEGINIGAVMFQNEAWSYTPYPGCAWTPEGIILFNRDYLCPTVSGRYPDVDVYFGTINTNRYDVIDQVLSDEKLRKMIKGVGLQWEGGQILEPLRSKYPEMRFVQTEGECGWGAFDWNAAEHTFERINHYLGNGAEDYTFWNYILADDGMSGWGWKQNALIRVDSQNRTFTLTPEYYAVKHYTQAIPEGSRIVAASAGDTPAMAVVRPDGTFAVVAANFTDSKVRLSVPVDTEYVTMNIGPHSMVTLLPK